MVGSAKKKGGKTSGLKKAPKRTFEDYFEEAELAYMSDDFETARASFAKAMEMEPDNVELLDAYGCFLSEVGDLENAIKVLQHACDVEPEAGFEKYMYLGQVLDQLDKFDEAQAALRKGIAILRGDLVQAEDAMKSVSAPTVPEGEDPDFLSPEALKESLSSALCTLAELLMGTASSKMEVDADGAAALLSEAETTLTESRELWPENPEPLQALCSLRKEQGKEEEALKLLRESMDLWFKPKERTADEDDDDEEGTKQGEDGDKKEKIKPADQDEEDEEEDDEDDDNDSMDLEGMDLPSYEFRFETSKLLLELDETADVAIQVLEGLLEENDAVPDVLLLLAMAYLAGGRFEEAEEMVEDGLEIAKQMDIPDDDELVDALSTIKTQIDDLKKKIAEVGDDVDP